MSFWLAATETLFFSVSTTRLPISIIIIIQNSSICRNLSCDEYVYHFLLFLLLIFVFFSSQKKNNSHFRLHIKQLIVIDSFCSCLMLLFLRLLLLIAFASNSFNELFNELYHFAIEFLPHCIIFNSMFHLLSNFLSLSLSQFSVFYLIFFSLVFRVCMRTLYVQFTLNFQYEDKLNFVFFFYLYYRKRYDNVVHCLLFFSFFSMNETVLLLVYLRLKSIDFIWTDCHRCRHHHHHHYRCATMALVLDKLKNLPKQTTSNFVKWTTIAVAVAAAAAAAAKTTTTK